MANPSTISCSQGSWQKVADNVTNGLVKRQINSEDVLFYETYRLHGVAAPTDLTDASTWWYNQDLIINSADPIDVYVYAQNKSGTVKVEL